MDNQGFCSVNPIKNSFGRQVELIDEDTLVVDEKYTKLYDKSDCSTKPRACSNCTCGRKESELNDEKEYLKKLEKGGIRSSCGNCYLGDAFRCASCPYAGLPAFKPGDVIQLQKNEFASLNGLNVVENLSQEIDENNSTIKVLGNKLVLSDDDQ